MCWCGVPSRRLPAPKAAPAAAATTSVAARLLPPRVQRLCSTPWRTSCGPPGRPGQLRWVRSTQFVGCPPPRTTHPPTSPVRLQACGPRAEAAAASWQASAGWQQLLCRAPPPRREAECSCCCVPGGCRRRAVPQACQQPAARPQQHARRRAPDQPARGGGGASSSEAVGVATRAANAALSPARLGGTRACPRGRAAKRAGNAVRATSGRL
jgi:hypothetical protein